MLEASFNRIEAALKNRFNLANLDEWIVRHTYLEGKKFSFKDHEFQIPILRDPAKTSIIVKCAQVGLSEIAYRWVIAACCVEEAFSAIYTFPTASDATKNCVTRINPMIAQSPEVSRLVSKDLNNNEVKQFGRDSFLFFKGTMSETQALSTPANAVISDEWDKSDITQASVYVSRLQHKPHKIRKIFSTPTVDRYGVSKEAETASRHYHLAKCHHCNHVFLPDYFQHIYIPGWNKPMEEITKQNLHTIRWREATLFCPKCGQDPNLHHTRMQFVCENQSENHEANAWFVSPFSAHKVISTPYLVETSTKFEKFSEFRNQTLGLTGEEKNEAILPSDISRALNHGMDLRSSDFTCMGSDMGVQCRVTIGRITQNGDFIIVHKERVHYTEFERRTAELTRQYRILVHVMDAQPYTDIVTRMTKHRRNNWGAMFSTAKSLKMFSLVDEEPDPKEGKLNLKMVKIARTAALDSLLAVIKGDQFLVQRNDEDELFQTEMLSLKRILKNDIRTGEQYPHWEKTDGVDHYHLSTLYLYTACQLRNTVGGIGVAGTSTPLISKLIAPKYPTTSNRNIVTKSST